MPVRMAAGIYLGIALVMFSGVALAWGLYPPRESTVSLQTPDTGLTSLIWTSELRSEDEGWVTLIIEPVDPGSGNKAASVSSVSLSLPDRASSGLKAANSLLEARLEMAGVRISPGDSMSQPMPERTKVRFHWQLYSSRAAATSGTVWLYLRKIPPGGGTLAKQLISVQPITIQTSRFLGMSGHRARSSGLIGGMIGFGALIIFGFRRRGIRG